MIGTHAQSDVRVNMVKRLGMNAIRFHGVVENDYSGDAFLYLAAKFKEAGIYWEVPLVVQNTDYTDETVIASNLARVVSFLTTYNPYTGMTLGEDPALAMVEMANEKSCLEDFYPDAGTWAGYTTQQKEDYITWAEDTEASYFNRFKAAIAPYTNALTIGSQCSYSFQSNSSSLSSIDCLDEHFYSNIVTDNATGPPYHMTNSRMLNDSNLWPYTKSSERINSKPFGSTEWNDWYPAQDYFTNFLTLISIAAWQDWAFMFHFQLGQEFEPNNRCYGISDDNNPGKKDMLQLGSRLFKDFGITPSDNPESNEYQSTYIADIAASGSDRPRAWNIYPVADPVAVGKGSAEVVFELNTPLEINLAKDDITIDITAYDTCEIVENGQTITITSCENDNVTWTPDTPTGGIDEFDGWGDASIIYDKVIS